MKKKPRASRTVTWITIVVCVILVFAVIWGIVTGVNKIMHYGQATQIESTPAVEPEKPPISVVEPEEPEIELPPNVYNADGFYELNGLRYYHGGDYIGVPGIDVSSYQSDIDWEAVTEAGVEFVIVRVGYRGYGASGNLDLDNCFYDHLEGAIAAGLDVGVYFFSQALTPEEAIEEAEFLLDYIEPYELQYPVVFDWEEVHADTPTRTDNMNMLMLTSCAEAFCKTITDAGYEAAIYFNQSYGYGQYNLSSLSDYDFWLAEYSDIPSFTHNFHMWQYTDKGILPGVKEAVDLNIGFRRKTE